MKVLWFTNTPCSAVEKLNVIHKSGGWLKSLEEELNKEVELAICFYSYQKCKPFVYNGTKFYPIFRMGKTKSSRLIQRYLSPSGCDKKEITKLLKVCELFKPDLIHIHGTEENFGLIQLHINIPIVISIQGFLNSIMEKFFSGIPFSIVSRYESIFLKIAGAGINYHFKRMRRTAAREMKILKSTKYIIGRTEWDKMNSRVFAPRSIYFNGEEILRSSFYNKRWEKKQFNDIIHIVTTSSQGIYKGLETVACTARILKDYSDLKFTWKIIGVDENDSIVRIINKWKNFKLQNLDIQLLGTMNEEGVVQTLLGSDIFCQVSHIENSSNSLCEAMMLGMPVIATFAGGTNSLLKDKEEGLLIQEGDPYSLAGAIMELCRNFPMANRFGNASRIRALIRHDKKVVIADYLKTYSFIMEKY